MNQPNWVNRTMWTGDNLDIMRGMNSESVDLIYLDPPFNSNQNYAAPIGSEAAGAAFKDTWTLDDVDLAWHGEIAEQHPALYAIIGAARESHGAGMQSYLIMMGVRILEMRRLLKPTGSIYLHCDPTASHYLKLLMDAVFGSGNFKTEVVWKRSSAHSDTKQGRRQHGRIHDILLFYTRSDEWTWNPVYTEYDREYVEKFYKHVEPGTGRRYTLGDIAGPGALQKGILSTRLWALLVIGDTAKRRCKNSWMTAESCKSNQVPCLDTRDTLTKCLVYHCKTFGMTSVICQIDPKNVSVILRRNRSPFWIAS